jgi:surfactin synthase thioesterase subunit
VDDGEARVSAIRQLRRTTGATRTVVIFPHAGGSANFYRGWATERGDVDFLAVQYPGRADRLADPCHRDLTELADELTADLQALPSRPSTFVGHSMGAVVAFEVARRWEAAGRAPVTLVASAARAPHDPCHVVDRDTPWDEKRAIDSLAATGQVDPKAFVDSGLGELVLPYLRADFEMLQRYEYVAGPPLNGEILAVTGADDPDVTAAHARLWRELTTGGFRHEELPGGHFYLVPDPPLALFVDSFQ